MSRRQAVDNFLLAAQLTAHVMVGNGMLEAPTILIKQRMLFFIWTVRQTREVSFEDSRFLHRLTLVIDRMIIRGKSYSFAAK